MESERLIANTTRPHVAVLALAGLLVAAPVLADIDVRKGGTSWVVVNNDGTVRVDGSVAGKVESDGTVRVGGSSVGSVDSSGTIRRGGSAVGSLESDGTLRRGGTVIGRVDSGGSIYLKGSSWGSASNCCSDSGARRSVAAVLFFFTDEFSGR